MKPIRATPIFLFLVVILPFTAFAGDFDGSKPLYGFIENITEINRFKINDNVSPDSVGLPQNFIIDFEENW